MSDLPFGFQPPSSGGGSGGAGGSGGSGSGGSGGSGGGSGSDGPGSGGPGDPFGMLFGGGGPQDLGAALHRMADLLSWSGGPVNWDLARDLAVRTAGEGDTGSTMADTAGVAEALRLADFWLDPVTTLPAGVRGTEAWSRRRWVEATLPVWRQLCDTVAGRVVDAMGGAIAEQAPAELGPMAGQLMGVMRQLGGAMFGTQVGQALGALAGEVLTSTEIGLPLGPTGVGALLPQNVAAFGHGLEVPGDEVRLYLAVHEAAHHRLFVHVPWLRSHLLGAVEAYARGITVDLSALQSALESGMAGLDPTDPTALQQAVSSGMFEPQNTPAQEAALARLETALALVEGWVDEVVDAAASAHLPHAGALRETVRRRRASGGPAEQTFATLVGLELRPRRLRDAAALWRVIADARGVEGRDAVWAHPDLLPTAEDLDDPQGFLARDAAGTDLDLSALDDALGGGAPPSGSSDEGDRPRDDTGDTPA